MQLLDDEQAEKLDVIQSDHRGDSEKCCTAMFKHWLKVDKAASWNKLITALKHISHVTLADKIKAMTSKGGVDTSIVLILHTCMYVVMHVWTCTYKNKCCYKVYTNTCGMPF